VLCSAVQDTPLALHPTGLPLTAKPLIDAGLLYDDEGQSIKAPNGLTRSVSIGDLISVGDSAGQSVSEEPSAGAPVGCCLLVLRPGCRCLHVCLQEQCCRSVCMQCAESQLDRVSCQAGPVALHQASNCQWDVWRLLCCIPYVMMMRVVQVLWQLPLKPTLLVN
jgi:hypothetical protein